MGHEKRKTSLLTWIWRHLCVCPLIDHGQPPMKMHTEVTLFYKVRHTPGGMLQGHVAGTIPFVCTTCFLCCKDRNLSPRHASWIRTGLILCGLLQVQLRQNRNQPCNEKELFFTMIVKNFVVCSFFFSSGKPLSLPLFSLYFFGWRILFKQHHHKKYKRLSSVVCHLYFPEIVTRRLQ